MRQTVRLGRFAGIPVGVHWSVLVIMVLLVQGLAVAVLPARAAGLPTALYWTVAVAMAIVFMAALLAHELGHALVARHYGIRVRQITLWLLGGVSELDGQAPHARGDLLIALAGPVVSLGAGVVCGVAAVVAAVLGAGALAVTAFGWLAVVNVVLAVFNLLPGAPLDGGRVLAAALWWRRGDRTAARRTASRAGVVLGGLLAAAGLAELLLAGNLGGLWLVLLGWFLASAARAEGAEVVMDTALSDVRVADVMTGSPVSGQATQSVANFIDTVARHRPYRVFPVVNLDGRPTGLVSLARLAKVPADSRDSVRLADVEVPLDRVVVLDPAAPLAEVAPTLLAGGHRLAVVASDGHLAGVVSTGDIARAVELAELAATPDRGTEPAAPLHE